MNSQKVFCHWFENQWLHSEEEGKVIDNQTNFIFYGDLSEVGKMLLSCGNDKRLRKVTIEWNRLPQNPMIMQKIENWCVLEISDIEGPIELDQS